ncbi:ABC transporter ATP-binding protein [Rubrivivax rivuli]|uniref:ABC transporter ATP-binding protein n=1 Tax=Rubrivivax rivuli TaxID=1862385 RepID=A0A437RR33_9BURK|nr:ABC transporter ATP-binding protein [Rubrivivax rivuli]RVU49256.1 ABC transporter ATP-binding protein [Rubrivivax rivuli]
MTHALALQTFELSKRFGSFTALDRVSIDVRPGTVHALLGENGAGKSTLVKCIVGYQQPDGGAVLLGGREHDLPSPAAARALGIGMVYQHFTVVPGMTVAENLLMAKGELPAVVNWRAVRSELQAFMDSAPFRLPLDATPQDLSAGERQKLEILKQLLLKPRLLILDEPTSVLTPQEADEVLGTLRERAHAGLCTVLMITHKFREVLAFADEVSVLRRGVLVAARAVQGATASELGASMVGAAAVAGPEAPASTTAAAADTAAPPRTAPGAVRLALQGLQVRGDRGERAVAGVDLEVRAGEIVGIAGVSGNGQRELMEALAGQRPREAGRVTVAGVDYRATRAQNRHLKVRGLPEEPLRNGCVGGMSVADNIGLRSFDRPPHARAGLRVPGSLAQRARELITQFRVKTQGEHAPMASLSGGNVQRAVLARELSEPADVLLVSNPVFGLDFTAVAEVHARLRAARDGGSAVLMVSEDLDELLQLADRIVVMSEGRFVHACDCAGASRHDIGRHMGGGELTDNTPDLKVAA